MGESILETLTICVGDDTRNEGSQLTDRKQGRKLSVMWRVLW